MKYEKRMKIPPFTTDEGVRYLTNSIASLEISTISTAFVSDYSHGMGY